MKRVLVIAHSFPPAGGGGVQRTAKFVKYLPEHGWQPHVLTVKEKYYDLIDTTLMHDIPKGVSVSRTRMLDVSRAAARCVGHEKGSFHCAERRMSHGSAPLTVARAISFVLKGLSHHLFVPDYQIGWLPFALIKGIALCRDLSPNVLYVTGSPYSSYLIGLLLEKIFAIPLVVDMRDAWTFDLWQMAQKTALKQRMEMVLEKWVVSHASGVICVQDHMCRDYKRQYGTHKNKFVTITNGFDPDDFTYVSPIRKKARFNIVYTGRLPGVCSLEPFFNALKILEEKAPEMAAGVCVTFVGELGDDNKALARRLGVGKYVFYAGYVPHDVCLSYMKGADVLLVLGRGENDRAMLPAKVFEYLAAEKPILALMSPHCATAHIVREAACVRIIENKASEAKRIAEGLQELCHDGSVKGSQRWSKAPKQYSRSVLAGRLAEVLDRIATGYAPKKNSLLHR